MRNKIFVGMMFFGIIFGVITVILARNVGLGAPATILVFVACLICVVAPAVINDPPVKVIDQGKLDREAYLKGVALIQDMQGDIDRETDKVATKVQLTELSNDDLYFMLDECPASTLRFRIVRELEIRAGEKRS